MIALIVLAALVLLLGMLAGVSAVIFAIVRVAIRTCRPRRTDDCIELTLTGTAEDMEFKRIISSEWPTA